MERIKLNEDQKGLLYELFEQLNAGNISHDSAMFVVSNIINEAMLCSCETLNYGYGDPTCNICKKVVDINTSKP